MSFDLVSRSRLQIQRARRQAWHKYQDDCANRKSMLEGDFLYILDAHLNKLYGDSAWRFLRDRMEFDERNNLLADVIGRTTQTYIRPARRAILLPDNPDAGETQYDESEEFAEAVSPIDYDGEMARFNRYLCTFGMAVIRPYIKKDKCHLQTLTPEEFYPITSYDVPDEMIGIEYSIYYTDDASKTEVGRTWVWDMEGMYIARKVYGVMIPANPTADQRAEIQVQYAGVVETGSGGEIVEALVGSDYPYRDLEGELFFPFVVGRYHAPPGRLVNTNVGRDLYDATLRVGVVEADKAWIMRNQSHKQIVLYGPEASKYKNQFIDPVSPITMGADKQEAGIDILDLKTDVDRFSIEKDSIYQDALTKRGWSLDEFKASAQRRSADAIQIDHEGKKVFLYEMQSVMRPIEHDLMESIRIVWNADSAGAAIPAGETSVDFGDPFKINVYLALDSMEKLAKSNAISIVDIVLGLNDDLANRDEALKMIRRNVGENREAKSRGFTFGEVAVPPPNEPQAADVDINQELEEEDEIGITAEQAPARTPAEG